MPPKKATKAKFNYKDLVLAKMMGFPAWPSFIMPPELIPQSIMKVKKKSTNFCVIFIPDGDYNWMNEKSLEALTDIKLDKKLEKVPAKAKSKSKGGKSKAGRTNNVADALLATKGLDFDEFMDMLDKRNNTEDADEDEEPEEEVEEDNIAENMKEEEDEEEEAEEGDSGNVEGEEQDDLKEEDIDMKEEEASDAVDDEEEDDDKVKVKSKRSKNSSTPGSKHASEADDEDELGSPAKSLKPLSRTRQSNGNNRKRVKSEALSSPTADHNEHNNDVRTSRSGKTANDLTNGANNGHRRSVSTPSTSAHHASSSTKTKTITGTSAKSLSEEEKQHQLWLCRIKLQRSLIQRNQPATPTDLKQFPPPSIDELSVARLILHRLVEFPVSIDLLKQTKIHKVLKCILRDEELEYPDSFKLHEKCEELLTKWGPYVEALKLEKMVKTNNPSDKKSNDDPEVKNDDASASITTAAESSSKTTRDDDNNNNNNNSNNNNNNSHKDDNSENTKDGATNSINKLSQIQDESRLSSQPPEDSEISAVETNGSPSRKIEVELDKNSASGESGTNFNTNSNINNKGNGNGSLIGRSSSGKSTKSPISNNQDVPVAASVEG